MLRLEEGIRLRRDHEGEVRVVLREHLVLRVHGSAGCAVAEVQQRGWQLRERARRRVEADEEVDADRHVRVEHAPALLLLRGGLGAR